MLRVEHLTKTYPNGTQALKDVSFEVSDGEFLVIIGLSGSGKSTLLRCINRLEEYDEGQIIVDGITLDTTANINAVRREVGQGTIESRDVHAGHQQPVRGAGFGLHKAVDVFPLVAGGNGSAGPLATK